MFQRRAVHINRALERYDADGFRAPMVHRHLGWLQDLDVQYDASCFDIDPFQAMPGGVGGPWPFIAGRFVELPYTLPQDHTLLIALGEKSIRIWQRKLTFLRQWSGMAMMLTHPDYLNSNARLELYRQYLEHVRAESEAWFALPREVAQWWRDRDRSQVSSHGSQITGPAASRGRVVQLGELFNRHVGLVRSR